MRQGNLKRLSLKVIQFLPEEVGERREDAQPAAPLALINETDPMLSRSKLDLLLCFSLLRMMESGEQKHKPNRLSML